MRNTIAEQLKERTRAILWRLSDLFFPCIYAPFSQWLESVKTDKSVACLGGWPLASRHKKLLPPFFYRCRRHSLLCSLFCSQMIRNVWNLRGKPGRSSSVRDCSLSKLLWHGIFLVAITIQSPMSCSNNPRRRLIKTPSVPYFLPLSCFIILIPLLTFSFCHSFPTPSFFF